MSLPLIISAATLIIFIIVVARTYPFLVVIIVKLLYGKFSFKYLRVHRKFLGNSPYGYCIKDDFINHIAGFFMVSENKATLKTNLPVLFGDISFGEKFGKIVRNQHKLVCLNAIKLPQFDLKIAGYRSEMFEYEMKTYYYFANNRFFMGEYSFKLPDDEKIKEISSIIQKKYLNSEKDFMEDFLIVNENQAAISFEHNGFHLSIKYLDQSDEAVASSLKTYWESNIRTKPTGTGDFERAVKSRL